MLIFFVGGPDDGSSVHENFSEAPAELERESRSRDFQRTVEMNLRTGKETVRYKLDGQGEGWAVYVLI